MSRHKPIHLYIHKCFPLALVLASGSSAHLYLTLSYVASMTFMYVALLYTCHVYNRSCVANSVSLM